MLSSFSSHWPYVWLVTASFIAGVMNAMAGGGSFLSFPAMLAMGVAADSGECHQYGGAVAGTVDVAWGRCARICGRDLLPVVLAASVMGGVSGALVLLRTRQMTFMHLVPWLLLVASAAVWGERAGVAMAEAAVG